MKNWGFFSRIQVNYPTGFNFRSRPSFWSWSRPIPFQGSSDHRLNNFRLPTFFWSWSNQIPFQCPIRCKTDQLPVQSYSLITKQSTSGSVSHSMLDWPTSGPKLFSDHKCNQFPVQCHIRLQTNFLSRPASWLRTTIASGSGQLENSTSGLNLVKRPTDKAFWSLVAMATIFIYKLWCDTIQNLNNVWICTRTLKAVSK